MTLMNVDADSLDGCRSDDAQQLSACAWVTRWCEGEFCDSPVCIGHLSPPVQHAMRAAGVAAQPAHSATLPPTSASTVATAEARLRKLSTALRMQSP
jgi:hypothetical protein